MQAVYESLSINRNIISWIADTVKNRRAVLNELQVLNHDVHGRCKLQCSFRVSRLWFKRNVEKVSVIEVFLLFARSLLICRIAFLLWKPLKLYDGCRVYYHYILNLGNVFVDKNLYCHSTPCN